MNLKIKGVLPLVCLSLMFSCQQNELLSDGDKGVNVKPTELNLQNFSYDDLHSLLVNQQQVNNLVLRDGEIIKEVKTLLLDTNVDLYDTNAGENTLFFRGGDTDSIAVIMNNNYASVKFMQNGDELGYLAFVNPETTEEVVANYTKEIPATRAALPNLITRAASGRSVKLNLTNLRKAVKDDEGENLEVQPACFIGEAPAVSEELLAEVPSAQTRTAYYTQWPRGNTLTIHLDRDTWDVPWEHEIDWQVSNFINSIRNIDWSINVKIWRSVTGFGYKSRDSEGALRAFRNHCMNPNYPWKEAVGHDIFLLVRHYALDAAGRAYVNEYKKSRYNNPNAFGFFSTTILNSTNVMAHEVGHILGASHVPARPWWQFWLKDDVMVPSATLSMSNLHFNQINRNQIWNNLH